MEGDQDSVGADADLRPKGGFYFALLVDYSSYNHKKFTQKERDNHEEHSTCSDSSDHSIISSGSAGPNQHREHWQRRSFGLQQHHEFGEHTDRHARPPDRNIQLHLRQYSTERDSFVYSQCKQHAGLLARPKQRHYQWSRECGRANCRILQLRLNQGRGEVAAVDVCVATAGLTGARQTCARNRRRRKTHREFCLCALARRVDNDRKSGPDTPACWSNSWCLSRYP